MVRFASFVMVFGVAMFVKGVRTPGPHCDKPDRFGYQLCSKPDVPSSTWYWIGGVALFVGLLIYTAARRRRGY